MVHRNWPARHSALVLMLDGLSADFLGPYGISWLETPTWNRLAAEGLLFDFAWTLSNDLSVVYRGFWQAARFPTTPQPQEAAADRPHLAEQLRVHAVRTVLMTDEPILAQCALADAFDERHWLQLDNRSTAAKDVENTYVADSLAATWEVVEKLTAQSDPFLLWIHLRALTAPWDAPRELREQLRDEEDPPPADYVIPPCGDWWEPIDPDDLWALRCAYGAQVMAIDSALGMFLAAVDQLFGRDAYLLIVGSPRGYALADHGFVGPDSPRLFSETLHIPLVIRSGESQMSMDRTAHLVQPADLWNALVAWWPQVDGKSESYASRIQAVTGQNSSSAVHGVVAQGKADRSLRTDRWFLRVEEQTVQLFVKPADRFDISDVSGRCPDEVRQLLGQLTGKSSVAKTGDE